MKHSCKNNDKCALVMAGGTGGHIFPALAVSQELKSNNWDIFWLGSKGGMEERIIGETDIPMNLISISGLRGNGLIGWLKAPFLLIKSVMDSVKIINQIKPNVVIGFGGFASGPGGIASYLLRKPLFIHEQNAVAGLTNRLLSKIAVTVFLGFPNAFGNNNNSHYKVVGNPIRKDIKNINKNLNMKDREAVNLLVLGGSRGAKALNEKIPEIIKDRIENGTLNVIHQSGEGHLIATKKRYEGFNGDYKVTEFIDEISEKLEWADVVICRAGASTVTEIAAVGLASIFIPYPYAVDDHQYFNAKWLADKGASIIIREEDINSSHQIEKINNLLDSPNKINEWSQYAKKNAYLNAAQAIADECDELISLEVQKV